MQGLYKKVLKGKYERLPKQYSKDLAQMVKSLLQTKSKDRPTCQEIMQMPMYLSRAQKILPAIGK